MQTNEKPALGTLIRRALHLRCPRCGKGRIFAAYLKPVEKCEACGEQIGHIRADDGPPWLTILVTGHIVVPLLLVVEQHMDLPLWVVLGTFGALTTALVLALLPLAKAFFIAMIWQAKIQAPEPEA